MAKKRYLPAYEKRVRATYISPARFKVLNNLIPITTVDMVVKTDEGVLLGKRNIEPLKNQLCLIGGRLYYGEAFEEAVKRRVMEETGLKVRIIRLVGVYSLYFTKGRKRHNPDIVYLVEKVGGKLKKDKQHSEFVYVKNLKVRLPDYVRQAIIDSGVFGSGKSGKVTSRFFSDVK